MAGLRHLAYAAGWKKFEPWWDLAIRARRVGMMRAPLETILSEFGKRAPHPAERSDRAGALPELQDTLHSKPRSDLETSAKVDRDQWTAAPTSDNARSIKLT
jgi:hypothetical protein